VKKKEMGVEGGFVVGSVSGWDGGERFRKD
jgi:hypothetical protein